jgi:predicted dienelactone hydrolase
MKQIFAPLILASLLATVAAQPSYAATGLATLPATGVNGPVTVFYPAAGVDTPVQRGPFALQALPEAAPVRGNGRLIVVSHGSGSAPWVYTELAGRLVGAGYIVAFPEHAGDNWQDKSKIGPQSFQLRPLEVSAAIDAVQADPRFAPLADFKQIGLWGMSAGGHTALSLAGGRWSAGQLRRHCEEHLAEATNACTTGAIEFNGGMLDGVKKSLALAVIRHKLSDEAWHSHTDPRIKAIIAGVPFAADFDMASLANPAVPLGLTQAQGDVWLLPKFNSGAVLQACKSAKNCELVADMPIAGHGALLAPLPPGLDGWLGRMLSDPPGFDRARDLPPMYESTMAFFKKHLLP